MSTVAAEKSFDLVHVRELDQLLAHGQISSRAALVDIASGAVLSRGRGSEEHRQIDDKALAALGRTVFASERPLNANRDQVRELCLAHGGIGAVTILMRESSLFLARLPASTRVLSLVVRHGESSSAASDTVVHARVIRSKLAPLKGSNIEAQAERQVEQSYSIWKSFFNAVLSRLTNAPPPPSASAAAPKAVMRDVLRQAVAADEQIVAGDLFDVKAGAHLDQYRHPRFAVSKIPDAGTTMAALVELFNGRLDVPSILRHFGFGGMHYGKVQLQIGARDFYWLRVPFFPAMHIPFATDTALLLYKVPRPNPALDWSALDHAGLNLLRLRIGALLVGGMKTEMFPFPHDQIEFQGIVNRLAVLPKDDLLSRLDIGGFAAHPVEIDQVLQRCQECIYYLPHRKWCDLPELPVPVEAGWWCRLWKI